MPLDGAFLIVAALTAAAALACAAGLLRGRFRRSPRRKTAAVLLVVLSAACYALSASGLRYHDLGQPVRAPDRLLTDLVTMIAMFAVLGLLILTGQAWRQAWPRIGHRVTALAVCVTGMALSSVIGTGSPETLAYFTLYVAFLGTALAEILGLSWQQAQLTWHRPLRHAGLLVTCGGAVAGIAALAGQTVWAVATAPHMLPPALPAVRSCAGLVNPVQCAFTVALPGASVLLAAAGVALPTLISSVAGAWRYWRQMRMLYVLGPLWERMRNTFPEIRLPEHGPRSRMDPAFRLYRRVIEIGAGRSMLRPYMRPEISAAAAEAAAQFGLQGEELRATVEAAEIVAALRTRRTSGCYEPQAWEPPPDHSDADVPDLPVETAWLVKVARAYATSPIVYQLMTPRRQLHRAPRFGVQENLVHELKRFAVLFLASSCVILGVTVPSALAGSAGYTVTPVKDLSSVCSGHNDEVEQATAPPHYVYEAWMGCGGEGFSVSADGGAHYSTPVTLPDSGGSEDPSVTVSPDGVVYVSYLRDHGGYSYPVVATSFNHGKTFTASSLIPPVKNNWGDRDFIAAGRGGTVYVTWDYGPSTANVKMACAPHGSCAYRAVDANAVVQKSTDYGKTWSPITPMQPGFPAGGGYDASLVVQPHSGVLEALIWSHRLDPGTYTVHPGPEVFTRSTDGGKTWSPGVEVGASAGPLSVTDWWINGNLSTDRAGYLYATWDTQSPSGDGDVGWLSYSGDGGDSWSVPVRVTPDHDNAVHIVESVGEEPGTAAIAWQADNSPEGYATYLRPFSVDHGWLAPATRVSGAYGNPSVWPGDTFGISTLPGAYGPPGSDPVALSWGSATGGRPNSEIYAAVAHPLS